MENKLELRVGDVVRLHNGTIETYDQTLLTISIPVGIGFTSAKFSVHRSAVAEIISSAETDAEKIARLEAELAKAPRRIKWSGGQCPVDPDSKVLVYLASNIIDCGKAKYFTWGSLQDHDNIIAYMVLPQ